MRQLAHSVLLGLVAALGYADLAAAQLPAGDQRHSGMSFLDNGTIRLGVNLDIGGAITYLADSKKRVNVVNSHDWGRQIQMSFYAGPKPYAPGGKQPAEVWKKLGWNPIQSGDYYGNRSRVIAHSNDGQTMYVKCIPMHWPLDNEPGHCTFETWIALEDNTVSVRCRLDNNRRDKTQYKARGQELPAIYTNGVLHRLMTYTGEKPFTADALTQIKKRWMPDEELSGSPWATWQATENWAALVDDHDWGLGVWTPNRYSYHGGFFGVPGSGGSKDMATGYISPWHADVLDHNIRYEYSYTLILGSLKAIRQYVYDHATRPAPLTYSFAHDRQHWHYVNCHDTGWPIRGELHVLLEGDDPRLVGPPGFWRAEDWPRLRICAAYRTKQTEARVLWKTYGDDDFSDERSLTFTIRPGGQYHTYEIDLSSAPGYRGIVTGLRVDPVPSGQKGDYVKIRSISFR